MEPWTISILLTESEYVQSETAGRRRVGALTVTGALLALSGVVLPRLFSELYGAFFFTVALLGLLLMLCELAFLPMYRRVSAAARYERQTALRDAVSLTVCPDALMVETARMSGRLPDTLLTAAYQTPDMLVFTYGAECTLRIPRRLLTEQQAEMLWARMSKSARS